MSKGFNSIAISSIQIYDHKAIQRVPAAVYPIVIFLKKIIIHHPNLLPAFHDRYVFGN